MKIPAFTAISNKKPSKKEKIHEIRVWGHPYSGGDDYYYRFKNLDEAKAFSKYPSLEERREKPLAVVKRKGKWTEVPF